MGLNGILLVSLFCGVCSAVSRAISWAGWPRFLKNWHISSHLKPLKPDSSVQRRLSVRNRENGVDEKTNAASSYGNLLGFKCDSFEAVTINNKPRNRTTSDHPKVIHRY